MGFPLRTNLQMLGHLFIPYFAPVGWASLLHSFFEVCLFWQQHFFLQFIFVLAIKQRVNWGKPERAPHRRVERDPCLSVCMRMSYREYTLLQITDPEFAKDCMCHVILVQWTWRDLCSQSTSQIKAPVVLMPRCSAQCTTTLIYPKIPWPDFINGGAPTWVIKRLTAWDTRDWHAQTGSGRGVIFTASVIVQRLKNSYTWFQACSYSHSIPEIPRCKAIHCE